MKSSILFITGLLLLGFLNIDTKVEAQIINYESFDATTFPPPGWTITGGANSKWVRRTFGTNPTCQTHSGAGMARFTTTNGGPGGGMGGTELMTTPVIDYSGANGSIPTFSLWIYRDGSSTAGDSITILVNTTTSLTGAVRIGAVARSRFFLVPINELTNGWYRYTFNVPATFTGSTNYILLNGTSHNGGNVYIDDLEWDEYQTACTAGPLTAGNVIAVDTLFCNGTGNTYMGLSGTGFTNGGLTFQWQSAGSASGPWTNFGPNSSNTVSGNLNTTTFFRCILSCNGGGSDTSSVQQVIVNNGPLANFTFNNNNLTYDFTDTSSPNTTTWFWDFGDGTTDITQNPSHTYTQTGTYTVTLTVTDGACITTSTQTISVVSVYEIANISSLNIYPNPVADNTTLEFVSLEKSVNIQLLNTIGKSVYNNTIYPVQGNSFKTEIDMSNLPSGIYLIQLENNSSKASVKLIKL